MKLLFEKWFCKHKWKSHSKQSRKITENNVFMTDYTREVLICEHCGKIKTIEY